MDPPAEDIEMKSDKTTVEKEGDKLQCDLYDLDIVYKIAQEFLPGLSSACIDNTTGGLFSSPASVAVEIRREMVDYLVQRSENFMAESAVLEAGPNEEITKDSYDIISDFIDDFASSKRNFFSRVSGWLLSERREDNIDDFVQEMEINGFWLLNRRESVVNTLLRNVDFKNMYHCGMSFKSPEDLAEHKLACSFRTLTCTNVGCNSTFSAVQEEQHDSICPFKIIQCEQNCPERIMRRDMDRHCITTCPMKLVKCPFYSVGCHSNIPQSTVGEHRSENLNSHLLYILQVAHKEASVDDLKERVEELIELSSPGQLAAARDARSLTYAIKNLEAQLGPLKMKPKSTDEVSDSSDTEEEAGGSPTSEAKAEEAPRASGRSVLSPSKSRKSSSSESSDQEKEKLLESPATITVNSDLENSQLEISKDSSSKYEDEDATITAHSDLDNSQQGISKESPAKSENEVVEPDIVEKSLVEENVSDAVEDDQVASPIKAEEHTSVAELESEQENKNDPASEKEEAEPVDRLSYEEKVSDSVKDEQHTSSPVNAKVDDEQEEAKEEHTNASFEKEDQNGSDYGKEESNQLEPSSD